MPFLRAAPPLILGIASYNYVPALLNKLLFAAAACMLFIPFLFRMAIRYRMRHIPGLGLCLAFFCTGHSLMSLHDLRNDPAWIGHDPAGPLIGAVTSDPRNRPKGISMEVDILASYSNNQWKPVKGRLMAYASPGNYAAGDMILVLSRPSPVKTEQTGYKSFLAGKNIHHTVRLDKMDLVISRRSPGAVAISTLKSHLLATLEKYFPEKNQRSLAQALLLGLRVEMDKEILTAYANTGVIHVIAISGMHLALIYGIIALILRPMKNKKLRVARISLILGALWCYALLCGASPSVVRSAVMFSFILCAEAIGMDHQPGNTLAGSAFILLCLEPVLLWDIGFQLSYAAVASLMLYSKPISRCYTPENKILANAWNTISATLAAQILTTPLAVFHFQQFPALFLLANLVAVPVSGIVLILLMLVCMLQPIGAAGPAAAITRILMNFMTDTVIGLDSVSFSSVKNIHIQWYDTLNIYMVIIVLTLWLRSKK